MFEAYSHSNHEGLIAASCIEKEVRFGSCVTKRSWFKRLRATLLEMKVGPSGSAIRSLIPSHRGPLWSKATVVNAAETSGQ